jgi:5-(carboxyamino)imidazole ribonucleotide synthase
MFAIAARRMGYRVHAFDPTQDCPTGQVADLEVNAAYDDLAAARRFAEGVDVVTFEFENVPAETLSAIEQIKPVHPSPFVLETCRHRLREKDWLSQHGFPVTHYAAVNSAEELRRAVSTIGLPAILKTAAYGYDGKGQVRIDAAGQVEEAWGKIGGKQAILEAVVPFELELSVIAARGQRGEITCFVPLTNEHRRHILDVTTAPGRGIEPAVAKEAVAVAEGIARELDVVGVIAVEMFLAGGKVLVNELAPRPHNSGHFSFDACVTSQFEQQLRAVCGLPLGDPTLLRPAAMANLLGDLWQEGEPDWEALLGTADVKLHLYGKSKPAVGRKMGHLTAMAGTAAEAKAKVLAARRALSRGAAE